MGTGESSARRDANRQITKAYYDALKNAERMKTVKRVSSKSARELDDALGGQLDYSVKRKALKADSLAREINATEKGADGGNVLNAKIGRFNDRYDILQKQLTGQSVTRYRVGEAPSQTMGMSSIAGTGLMKDHNSIKYFNSEAEANQSLAQQQEAAKASRGFMSSPVLGGSRAPELKVMAEVSTPLSGHYREKVAHMDTFNELNQYATEVSKAPSADMRQRYGKLAEQIRAGVSRSATTVKQPGLLSGELANNNPVAGMTI